MAFMAASPSSAYFACKLVKWLAYATAALAVVVAILIPLGGGRWSDTVVLWLLPGIMLPAARTMAQRESCARRQRSTTASIDAQDKPAGGRRDRSAL